MSTLSQPIRPSLDDNTVATHTPTQTPARTIDPMVEMFVREARKSSEGCEPNHARLLRLAAQLHEQGDLTDAAQLYTRLVENSPTDPNAPHLLGLLEQQRNRHDEAATHFETALDRGADRATIFRALAFSCFVTGDALNALLLLDDVLAETPNDSLARLLSAHAAMAERRLDRAILAYRAVTVTDPTIASAWAGLGQARLMKKDVMGAADALARAIELDPDDGESAHLLAAALGETPDAAPPAYIRSLFDLYAETFDAELVENLNYDVPTRMQHAIADTAANDDAPRFDTLDLGCGTGLAGVALAGMTRTLEGVDLSPRMLDQAEARGCYDTLHCRRIDHAIDENDRCDRDFDLITAADVFIYTGDLEPIFSGIRLLLRSGGRFVFSTKTPRAMTLSSSATVDLRIRGL